MKTIYILLFMFLTINSGKSQLTNDYPFKTFLDTVNNLYVTGYKLNYNQLDISYQKFNSGGIPLINKIYLNSGGNDRGMDIKVDRIGNAIITGFIFNLSTNSNDIITLYYNQSGTLVWDSIIANSGDDKAYGIDIELNEDNEISEIYLAGYMSNIYSQPMFVIKKLDRIGNTIWQRELNLSGKYSIATDIFVDAGFVYVSGYSYQGPVYGDDITLVVLDKDNGTIAPGDIHIHNVAGSNERPTSLSIASRSRNTVSKSRSVVTSISETFYQNPNIQNDNSSSFYTTFFEEDENHNLNVRWAKKFSNRRFSNINIPTSVTTDALENVYVSGYTKSGVPGHDLDFVTMKISGSDGSYMWPNGVEYYNNSILPSPTYNDKASSVKIGKNNEFFVAGTSDASPFGYSVISYKNETPNGPPIIRWTKTFKPIFDIENGPVESETYRAAQLEVDSEGQPILIAMEWNANGAEWKARKYDTDGNILYTIGEEDNTDQNSFTDPSSNLKILHNDISETELFQNKPNPFNPATDISFNVSQNGFVNIKVYNLLGQEVAALVNELKQPGRYKVIFDGSGMSSGMYFYKMFVNGVVADSRRMLLLK